MRDRLGREINYMRISITDRCNLRCKYCMPQEIARTFMDQLLTYEEIVRVVREAVALGITDYRITGGEPLVRRDCQELIRMMKAVPGVRSVDITTNGVLLQEKVKSLKEAGLDRINVSLDTMDRDIFCSLTGCDDLEQVLSGIAAATQLRIPLKLNVVNRTALEPESILEYGEQLGIPVRFIEIMPIGYGKEYVGASNEELIQRLERQYGRRERLESRQVAGSGPAVYYHFQSLQQPVGFISAMNHKFCHSCNRIRLTSEGYLKLCLCYEDGADLRQILRDPQESQQLRRIMEQTILQKPVAHCFDRVENITEEKGMSRIGG